MKAIAFIPEIKSNIKKTIELSSGLFLLAENNKNVRSFKKEIEGMDYKLEGGIYLYFDGTIRTDGTLYEIFQSYGLALTFYYEGLATCRVYKEIGTKEGKIELFIDENDTFGYDKEDGRVLYLKDIEKIAVFYNRISDELSCKKFNPLVNSFEFFNRFLKEREIKPRLLYLNICLESIFLAGSDSEGISYKLGIRCSSLLYKDDDTVNKNDMYTEVKNGYDLRSKIIHGGNYEKVSNSIIKRKKDKNIQGTELDHVIILEQIVKRVFKIILKNDDFYNFSREGELGKQIDDLMVLT